MTDVERAIEGITDEEAAIAQNAVEAALAHEGRRGGVAVMLTDDAGIWEMNREYRHVDRPTDVLSFPSDEGERADWSEDGFIGDIAVSMDRARAQAAEYGHSLKRELSFLCVHGALHLLGYDHMDDADRDKMFAMQEKILEEMKITR